MSMATVLIDIVSETTTMAIDVDGDGIVDIVEQTTTTTAYDVDGDGEPDVIESTTITGIDVDGDGQYRARTRSRSTRPSRSAKTCSTNSTRLTTPSELFS